MSESIESSKVTGDTLAPKLKVAPLEIDPTKVWADDTLDRERVADALTKLVRPEAGPLVLTLNGGWGTGKTFFLERWRLALEQSGMCAIYFNAWEDDYCGDPLVAILGQLKEDLGRQYRAKMQAVFNAAKKVGTRAAFKFVSTASGGLLDAQSTDFSSTLGDLLDEYKKEGTSRTQLKKALVALTEEVKKKTDGPLVFIIDELDRCRPTFTIELLERVKHLFGIPNMVFILGIDHAQLGSSVKSVYGDIEIDGYLRRFFDMDFALPAADSAAYCKNLMARHQLEAYFQERSQQCENRIHIKDYGEFQDAISFLCAQLSLSLREIEQIVRQFVFVARNVKDKHRLFPILLAILLLLRSKDRSLYDRYVCGKCPPGKVLNLIEKYFDRVPRSSSEAHSRNMIAIVLYLTSVSESRTEDPLAKEIQLKLNGQVAVDQEQLSEQTRSMSQEQFANFAQLYQAMLNKTIDGEQPKRSTLGYLSGLIELLPVKIEER